MSSSPPRPTTSVRLTALSMKPLFRLQNTIHWIKSISIKRGGDTNSYGHFKPIKSGRYLTDCHEYVFHFTPSGKTKLDRLGIGVPYADKSKHQEMVAHRRQRQTLSREYLVYSLQNHSAKSVATPAPSHLPHRTCGEVHPIARKAKLHSFGPVPGRWAFGSGRN